MKSLLLATVAGAFLTPVAYNLTSVYHVSEIRHTTFSFEGSSSLVEMGMTMNGVDRPGMPEIEQEKTLSFQGTFIDAIQRIEDDQPIAFEREYTALAEAHEYHMSDPSGVDHDDEGNDESALEGLHVQFTREKGEFVAKYREGESGDKTLLKNLDNLLPWPGFLPEENVEVEDEWKVEPEVLWRTMHIGGDLAFSGEQSEDGPPRITPPTSLEDVELKGKIKATFASVEEIDGVPHARITLTIDFTSVQDLTDAVPDADEEIPEDAPEGMVMPEIESMELEVVYEGEGTLLWNLESGYLAKLEVTLETQETQLIVMAVEMGPKTMEMEQSMIMEGGKSFTIEVGVTRE